jgi:hypothetical protein
VRGCRLWSSLYDPLPGEKRRAVSGRFSGIRRRPGGHPIILATSAANREVDLERCQRAQAQLHCLHGFPLLVSSPASIDLPEIVTSPRVSSSYLLRSGLMIFRWQ